MYHCSKCVMASPFQSMIDLPKEVMELVYRQARDQGEIKGRRVQA